jgi:HPt (histidine-containing phosphotransfer) domain-containing protein
MPHDESEAGAALDQGVLATLHALEQRGQLGLLRQVVALYLQEAPAQLAALRGAVAQADAGGVEQTAHALKGSSAQLGATRLARLCAALQEEGARQELSQAAAQVDELASEFLRVRAALEAMLSETGFS